MTPSEFKTKWARFTGKESSAYQEHFNDLCALLGLPTPAAADPTGSELFCFQKRVVKDAELFDLDHKGEEAEPSERGFADVWKKDCFAWEYKGKKKNLDDAYRQLQRYRESLLNPPLLVVCDFDRYIIRTNFNGTVQETFEFTNARMDDPKNLKVLRALFENPDLLKPQRTTAQITKQLAEKFGQVARSLQKRESAEFADARTRAEVTVAQKKNLRIARFLNRLIFCFFAEDTGLLPKGLFSEIARTGLDDPRQFTQALENLFRVMARGGMFGQHKIRHFNGHLFEEASVFELNADELRSLAESSEADWQFVEPSIMGTLFARGLDPDQRAALGAQYTDRGDIVTIVEPVLMAPLRREWAKLKAELTLLVGTPRCGVRDEKRTAQRAVPTRDEARARLAAFLKKLRALIVMDPACGSGNFLYVALQMLLDLEKEVINFAALLGFQFKPAVGVQQLRAIEINAYAYELAQVTVQIGYLQWLRDNGFPLDRSPVLQVLDGFQNEDALLVPHYHSKAKNLKEAQAQEHETDTALKFYTERDWPSCDVIVSNPPFLGGKMMRRELGDACVDGMFQTYGNRVPPEADLCCYWFEKARALIEAKKCKRAGLLATQGIRGGANREVLKQIKDSGDIFFAISDRDWILDGANVHISMVGFDNGDDKQRTLDGRNVPNINPNLSAVADITEAALLQAHADIAFMGTTKGGPFDIPESLALELLRAPNPHGRPNSDVVVPWVNGMDLTKRPSGTWIVDFGLDMQEAEAAKYQAVFEYVRAHVKPQRDKSRTTIEEWWLHERRRGEMRVALAPQPRFICTTRVSKHRLFVWLQAPTLPDSATFAFARADDFFFGILHSRFHEVWGLKLGTRLETRPRYTPTTCFETFPFPCPTPAQEPAIASAAKELNELRERWLNPPEWTREEILEFPGTVGGPWARYVECGGLTPPSSAGGSTPAMAGQAPPFQGAVKPAHSKVGLVRYPRLVPRDADCAAKLKKRTLTNLYNERPAWLDLAHKKLDAAVAAAYGWPADLSDEQILEKLLALNLERAAEEEKAAKTKKPKTQRGKREDEIV